jgi:arginine/lysine/ornithine decarboxylase
LCVTSVHKNLGSISATALINIGKKSRINAEQIKDIFIMVNTTSPSPYLLFDIEGNIRTWKDEGQNILRGCSRLRKLLKDLLSVDKSLTNLEIRDVADGEADMTKIVIKIQGMTGSEIYHLLDEKRINIEKYTQ